MEARRTIRCRSELSPKQTAAWDALARADVSEACLAGAKGSSKTSVAVIWIRERCLGIVDQFKIPRLGRQRAIAIGFMGRHESTKFESTTLRTWIEHVPPELYEIQDDARRILFLDRLIIDCGGVSPSGASAKRGAEAARDNRFQGARYAFTFVDQAEEITLDEAGFIRATLNRPIQALGNVTIPGKAIWAANPPYGWLRQDFRCDPPKPGFEFLHFTPEDNPWLDPGYLKQLEISFGHNRALYEAYRFGIDNIGAVNQIIQPASIDAALRTKLSLPDRIFLAVDPAWYGDDRTVVLTMNNTDIVARDIWGGTSQPENERRIHVIGQKLGGVPIAIDATGTCGAQAEHLEEMGNVVIRADFSAAPSDPHFANLRAEMWWQAGQKFERGDVELSECPTGLREELCAPRLDVVRGKIQVEEKSGIKGRLGRSPDEGDAYVIGLWAGPQVAALAKGVDWNASRSGSGFGSGRRRRHVSAMAG